MSCLQRLILLLCLVCVSGCAAPTMLVVLAPDREGHVGNVNVTNDKGSVTLSKAGESATISNASSAPEKKEILSQSAIHEVFGDALAAEPPAAVVFRFYFRSDSHELDAATSAKLESALKDIRQMNSRDISINGHTDTRGDVEYNLKLSHERAHKIRDLLVRSGIKPEYLSVANHGKGNPVVPTADNVAEPRNRCVEVIVR